MNSRQDNLNNLSTFFENIKSFLEGFIPSVTFVKLVRSVVPALAAGAALLPRPRTARLCRVQHFAPIRIPQPRTRIDYRGIH